MDREKLKYELRAGLIKQFGSQESNAPKPLFPPEIRQVHIARGDQSLKRLREVLEERFGKERVRKLLRQ